MKVLHLFISFRSFFQKPLSCLRARQFEKMHGCMIENLQKGIADGFTGEEINVDFISRIYFTGLPGVKDSRYISFRYL